MAVEEQTATALEAADLNALANGERGLHAQVQKVGHAFRRDLAAEGHFGFFVFRLAVGLLSCDFAFLRSLESVFARPQNFPTQFSHSLFAYEI